MCPDLKLDHLGWKGSFATDKNLEEQADKIRNWHYMWSFFYYHKKNYGYIYSLISAFKEIMNGAKMIPY